MAYEHRIYIVKPSTSILGECHKYWAKVIAVFNLGYTPDFPERLGRYPDTKYYIYADDGYTEITEDHYGDPLIEIPIRDLIDGLESLDKKSTYVIATLAALKIFKGCTGDLVALHYGY